MIKTGHSRLPYVSSFTFSDARLLMWELILSNKRLKAFTFWERKFSKPFKHLRNANRELRPATSFVGR